MAGGTKNRKGKNEGAGNDEARETPKPNKSVEFVKSNLLLKQNPKANQKDNTKIIAVVVILFVVPVAISWTYNNHLASLVNQPLSEPRVVNSGHYKAPENLDRFWGTYR